MLDNIVLGTEPLWRPRLGGGGARAKLDRDRGANSGWRSIPTRAVSRLSVGERQRVEILKALYRDARILILDEPTAVLTPQETEALFATLRDARRRRACRSSSSATSSPRCCALCHRIAVLRGGRQGRRTPGGRAPTARRSPN